MKSLLFSLVLIVSCGGSRTGQVSPVGWTPPFAYREIPAESWYQGVWDSVVICITETKPITKGDQFVNMRWFVVNGSFTYILPNGDGAVANWDPFNRIFVSSHLFNAAARWVIAHEIMHAAAHIYDHPKDPFERCMRKMYPLDFPQAVIKLNDLKAIP